MGNQRCPSCNTLNPASATDCSKCKTPLDLTITITDKEALKDSIRAAKAASRSEDMWAEDGVAPDHADVSQEIATRTVHVDDDANHVLRIGTVRLKGDLVLTEIKTGTQFRIRYDELYDVAIGRRDQARSFTPQVDLTGVDGLALGVSRLHATISWRDNVLMISDHHSKNGTFINGHRLVPHQPRVLRDDDIVALGQVILTVTYHPELQLRMPNDVHAPYAP